MFVENNDIITGKLDSSLCYNDKNEVFVAICEAVNAIGGNNRTVESVKNCWQTIKMSVKSIDLFRSVLRLRQYGTDRNRSMKSKAGKFFSKEKKSVKKTGGGEAEVNTKIEDILTEEEMKVFSVIKTVFLYV